MLRTLALLLTLLPFSVLSQSTDYGSVKLLRGWQMEDGSYQTALAFTLNPGWKTYWRSPGPAGLPPIFAWDGSNNIAEVSYSWPTPEVMDQDGMITVGYYNGFVLPIRIAPAADGPVRIALSLQFGVCSDICVPAQAVFLARLDGSANHEVEVIKAALLEAPLPAAMAGLESISCDISPSDRGFSVTANIAFEDAIESPFTVIEHRSQEVWVDMATSSINGASIQATAPMQYYGSGEMEMDNSELIVSVFGANRAVEIRGCPG